MSLNTIQDLERYSITMRLERECQAGDTVIHLRSTPVNLVGATIWIEPETVRAENRTVTAVSEHQVTIDSALTYTHEADAAIVRMDMVGLITPGNFTLANDITATESEVTVNATPNTFGLDQYIVIDPYTSQAEVRRITSIDGMNLGFNTGLLFNHSSGDAVMFNGGDGIINARWFGARGDGITDDAEALQIALEAAKESDSRKLYIPAGTYRWENYQTQKYDGYWNGLTLEGQYPYLEVFGDGMGKTVLYIHDFDLTATYQVVIRVYGKHQVVRDLTIRFGTISYPSGDRSIDGIGIGAWGDNAGFHSKIIRCEIDNLIGWGVPGPGSGSCAGIAATCFWSTKSVNTVLSSAITGTGAQTFYVDDKDGFNRGMRITVGTGASEEEVIITSLIPDSLIATFANTHAEGEPVWAYSQGFLHALIEDCYVHDSLCNAYGCNSNGNIFRGCKAKNAISDDAKRHGIYLQGGWNDIINCWFEGWSGYHIHGHKQVPRIDGSGDRFIGCVSINPQFQHLMINTLYNDTAPYNPEVPVDGPCTRHYLIEGCVFRNENGYLCGGVGLNGVRAIVNGNIFEDVYQSGGGGLVDANNCNGSIITNNMFLATNTPAGSLNMYAIRVYNYLTGLGDRTIIANNNINGLGGINVLSSNCMIQGNIILEAAITISGENQTVINNIVERTSGNTLSIGTSTDFTIRNNSFKTAGGGWLLFADLSAPTGIFEDNECNNTYIRWQTGINPGLIFRNNRRLSIGSGSYAAVLGERSGRLELYTVGGGAGINHRRLMKLVANALVECAITDTDFIGVSINNPAAGQPAHIISDIGAVCEIDADGAWTAGNYGIISTSAAGKIMDNGASKGTGSYVLFLDSGGGAGVATCRILKTL